MHDDRLAENSFEFFEGSALRLEGQDVSPQIYGKQWARLRDEERYQNHHYDGAVEEYLGVLPADVRKSGWACVKNIMEAMYKTQR